MMNDYVLKVEQVWESYFNFLEFPLNFDILKVNFLFNVMNHTNHD